MQTISYKSEYITGFGSMNWMLKINCVGTVSHKVTGWVWDVLSSAKSACTIVLQIFRHSFSYENSLPLKIFSPLLQLSCCFLLRWDVYMPGGVHCCRFFLQGLFLWKLWLLKAEKKDGFTSATRYVCAGVSCSIYMLAHT